MTTKGYENRPSIDRLKDGAGKLARLYASEGMSKRVELGIAQWEEIETGWRWEGILDCPLDPEFCGDVPKCQFCKGTTSPMEDAAASLVLIPTQVLEATTPVIRPSLEEIKAELEEEVMILAGTWGMIDDSDDEELTDMLSEGIDTVDNLMIKYFALGGEGCPLGGCRPEAAVRCKVCAGGRANGNSN